MIRMLAAALALGAVTAPIVGGTHDKLAACNGFVTAYEVGDQIIYNDDRGRDQDGSDADGDGLPTVPGATGAWWLYLETNGHGGLQTGGDHAALGETPTFSDSCVNVEGDHTNMPSDSVLF